MISSYRQEVVSSTADAQGRAGGRGLPRTDHKPLEGIASPRRLRSWHLTPPLEFLVLGLQGLRTSLRASTLTSATT